MSLLSSSSLTNDFVSSSIVSDGDTFGHVDSLGVLNAWGRLNRNHYWGRAWTIGLGGFASCDIKLFRL